jgi:hypothetical protein
MENIGSLLEEYDSSGLSGREFARRKGIKVSRLYYYLGMRRKIGLTKEEPPKESKFIEVGGPEKDFQATQARIEVYTASGHKIVIPMV